MDKEVNKNFSLSRSENKAWKNKKRRTFRPAPPEILYRPEFFSSLIFTTAQLVFITANCFHINIPDLTTDNLKLGTAGM